MSDMATGLDREQIDSIVLGVAENTARELGIRIDAGALDALMTKAKPALDVALERDELQDRRDEITRNTQTLIKYISQPQDKIQERVTLVTASVMAFGLKDICKYFPDLFPFCP
jgi:hypothetical protein